MADKGRVTSVFQLNGLLLQRDARNYVFDAMQDVPQDDQVKWLESIVDQLQRQNLESASVSARDVIQAVTAAQQAADGRGSEKVFTIIDAFTIPKFAYNQERKKFLPASDSSLRSLYGSPDAKAAVFLNRYTIIHQRLLRHDLFQPPIPGRSSNQQGVKFQMKPIEYLLGCSSAVGDLVVLGMLTQLKEGVYYLEDPTGAVKLDLSETKFHNGFFTESTFVLAEGVYEDGVFHVKGLGFPPSEIAAVTRSCFGNINFFGGASSTCVKASTRLKALEESNPNTSFVFIADVWLDDIKVMERLRRLFEGFAEFPPTCFIFMGNFTSVQKEAVVSKTNKGLDECFVQLAAMISEFPTILKASRLVFVPGPLDPGLTTILPRPPIPLSVTQGIRNKLPHVVFTTNPCHIQYCTQEIVVFREDLLTKMCRNCVHFPTVSDIPANFAKSLAAQSHLCPLPLHIAPIYWEYDHTLGLYPLPDMVVCADKFDPFTVTQSGCIFTNPSSFSRNDYVFKVYIPASRQVEDSCIPDDT